MLSHFQFIRKIKSEKAVNLIGLDIGNVFIGIATAKDVFKHGKSVPITTLNRKQSDIIAEINKIIPSMNGIIVGMPTTINPNNKVIIDTVNYLSKHINLPFVSMNEDYSSVDAANYLYQINPRYAKSKYLTDQIAACIILDNFIKHAKEYKRDLPINLD